MLYPPAPHRPYHCDRYGDFVFMVSRLTPLKRADLLIRALAAPDGQGIKAIIAGDGAERSRLTALVAELDLADRVRLVGPVSQPELLHYLAHCRAVCFPPRQEDYGFVTVEAFASRKAVVTCTDSGGPAELVEDGVRGFVVAPTPPALAAALRRCGRQDARGNVGRSAFEMARSITGRTTVAVLLARRQRYNIRGL